MISNKKWGSALLAGVLLIAPVSAVQAKSPVSAVIHAQAGDLNQTPSSPNTNQAAASSAVEETQFRNLAAGLPYEWSEEPEASHPDGGTKLTDGKYGTLDMNDPAWVGHQRGKTREVVFDQVRKNNRKDYSTLLPGLSYQFDPRTFDGIHVCLRR